VRRDAPASIADRITTARRSRRLLGCCSLAVFLVSCAPRPISLPSGAGEPFPEFASAHAEAVKSCAGVRTLSAEVGLSGRAGGRRLRVRLLVGVEAPDRARIEGIALGSPVFILVARDSRATLLLPRDDRVLRDADPGAVVEALAGVTLTPADLRAILSGCATIGGEPAGGRRYSDGWTSVDLRAAGTPEATVYLRHAAGSWRIAAARVGDVTIRYGDDGGAVPRTVRLVAGPAGKPTADLMLELAQVETNTPFEGDPFTVNIPQDAEPITLDELREAGPLGRRR
jgi:hypothetical protein